jgi:hypothetical protein
MGDPLPRVNIYLYIKKHIIPRYKQSLDTAYLGYGLDAAIYYLEYLFKIVRSGMFFGDGTALHGRTFLRLGVILALFLLMVGSAHASYHATNNYLNITVGERGSDAWKYHQQNSNGTWSWITCCYSEIFAAYSESWGTSAFGSSTFSLVQSFGSGNKAILRRGTLNVSRQVEVPTGDAKYFTINYTLTNTGTTTLSDLRFFEITDFDVGGLAGDNGWYDQETDSVWINDQNYYRVGYSGNMHSSHHGVGPYPYELDTEWKDGILNDSARYPETGTSDTVVALQWNLGNLDAGAKKNINITFYFGFAPIPEGPSISGMKFHDLNGDGAKDGNEPGLKGWTIRMNDSSGNETTTTTNANGFYNFTDLTAGTYTISEDRQPGWIQTFPANKSYYVILSTGPIANKDFGNIEMIISTSDSYLNCSGICPALASTINDSFGSFSYQWYNNSVIIPGASGPNFTSCYPGTYSLAVTNTTSGKTNSSNRLVIHAKHYPLVTISTTDAYLSCTNACPILFSTIDGGTGPFSYQWYNNSAIIDGATNPNFAACFPGTYSLTVTNTSSGCSNSSNLLIIRSRFPLVTISTPDAYLNCSGTDPILKSTVTGNIGPFAYQWYNNSVLIDGATNPNFAACFPGTYSLTVTNTSSGCANNSNQQIIYPIDAHLVAISTTNAYLNCTGPCPILRSTVTGGTGPFSYQWYNNSAIIDGATNPNFAACYPGTYSLMVTNTSSGCANNSNQQVIYPVDAHQVAISTTDAYLNCTGPCPILRSTVTGGTGPFVYQWYNDSAIIDGATNPNFAACFPGTYRLTVANMTSGCINSSGQLIVHPRSHLVKISTSDAYLNCSGTSPILKSTVIGGTGPFTRQWYNDSAMIPGANGPSFTACYPGNYSLVVTNTSSGCINSSNPQAIRPKIYPLVSIFTPDAHLNCTGTCPILRSTVTGGTGPFAYQWYNNSAIIPDATSLNFIACHPGNYSLAVTNTSSSCVNNSNQQFIYPIDAHQVAISTPDAYLNCTGPCPILRSTVTGGAGPFVYQWYNDSAMISGAASFNFAACYPGNYSLVVTNASNGCSNRSSRLAIHPRSHMVRISTPDSYLNCSELDGNRRHGTIFLSVVQRFRNNHRRHGHHVRRLLSRKL